MSSYKEYIDELLAKYGPVINSYFCNEFYRSKNKLNPRKDMTLYAHHINEDKIIRLSDSNVAKLAPSEYQQAENLVYCDLYEHFLLHQKIILEGYLPKNLTGEDKLEGVIEYIIPNLCSHFIGKEFSQSFRQQEQTYIPKYRNEFIKEFAKLYHYIVSSNNPNAVEIRERLGRMNYSLKFPDFILQEKPYMKNLKTPIKPLTEEQKLKQKVLMNEIKAEINRIK